MIAQSLISPDVAEAFSVGKWLAVFGTLFAIYSKVRAWEKSVRSGDQVELKQPLDITLKQPPFTRIDHEAICGPLHHRVRVLEKEVLMIRGKMEADKTEIIQAGEERVEHLHRRIDGLKDDIAAQPAQIVALLKNTKGLIP